jgi:branched-chain amino acid transport system permease protein
MSGILPKQWKPRSKSSNLSVWQATLVACPPNSSWRNASALKWPGPSDPNRRLFHFISFLFSVFLYVTLASSWNILGGYAGYLSFGHVAFFGIGAYAVAILAKFLGLLPTGTLLAAIPAGLISAIVAVIVGYPCLRLRGPYFAVITLCFSFVAQLVVKNLDFTSGPDGLWLKALDVPIHVSRSLIYELMLALTLGTVVVSRAVTFSRFGAGLRAIKEDEEVAQTMAINSPFLKIKAFALSAFFPGIAGASLQVT